MFFLLVKKMDIITIPILDEKGKLILKLDDNGQIHPRCKDNYTQEEIIKIHKLLGENIQKRFENNKINI